MGFLQKVKFFLQLLFISGLFLVNAAVYQKYNYFSYAKHLDYIPKASVFSITVNTNRLAGQVLYDFIYKNDELVKILGDAEIKDNEKSQFIQSGVDLTSQLTFFMSNHRKHKNLKYAGVLVDLSSESNFTTSIEKDGYKSIEKGGIYKKNKRQYAVVSNGVALLAYFKDSSYVEQIKTELLLDQFKKKDNTIAKIVSAHLQGGFDAVIYGLPENISAEPLLMDYFVSYGKFEGDAFQFNTDFIFKDDITAYFPKHDVNKDFDFESLDGYFYLKSTFQTPNADRIFDKLAFFSVNDSVRNMLNPVLKNQQATGLELYCFDLNKAQFKVREDAPYALKMMSKNFYLPGFDFKIYCNQPSNADTIFNGLVQAGIMKNESSWYIWKKDDFYNLYFGLKSDRVSITTKPNHESQNPQCGYSNVFYFNIDKFNDKLPDYKMRFLASEFKLFESILMYSFKAEKNKLQTKGEVVFLKGHDGLFEFMKSVIKIRERDLSVLLKEVG